VESAREPQDEITPEMADAGVEELCDRLDDMRKRTGAIKEAVVAVYLRMLEARDKARRTDHRNDP
jgi:hypothetical protein